LRYADGTTKVKGAAFNFEPSSSKQANLSIIHRAVAQKVFEDIPLEVTIRGCRDIHQFLGAYSRGPTITEVKRATGPSDPGTPLPDLIRYYFGAGDHHIYRRNAKSWTRVADTQGFAMCNQIPLEWPLDLNYTLYIALAQKLLDKL
jgi:hypothetical protein